MNEIAGLDNHVPSNDDDLVRAFSDSLSGQLGELTGVVANAWSTIAPENSTLCDQGSPCWHGADPLSMERQAVMHTLIERLGDAANHLAAAHEALSQARYLTDNVASRLR